MSEAQNQQDMYERLMEEAKSQSDEQAEIDSATAESEQKIDVLKILKRQFLDIMMEPMDDDPEKARQAKEDFQIDSVEKFEWAIQRLKEARFALDDAKASAKAHIKSAESRLKQSEWFLRDKVAIYARANLVEGRKYASTPAGRVKFRRIQEKIEVENLTLFLAWAKEHASGLIRVKYEPNRTEINAALKDQLDLPPGLARMPAHDSMSID